jgi:hypothetical protein
VSVDKMLYISVTTEKRIHHKKVVNSRRNKYVFWLEPYRLYTYIGTSDDTSYLPFMSIEIYINE